MSPPLVFVATFKVREGKIEELQGWYNRIAEIVETKEPREIAYNGFVNEEGTEMTSIQVHPDAASMETHMHVLRDAWDESFAEYNALLEGVSVGYYGPAPESAVAMDRDSGLPIDLEPLHLGGFTRTSPGP